MTFYQNKKENKHSDFRNKKFSHRRDSSFIEKNAKDRISKRLAMLGVASRREAEKLVLEGKVKINGIESKDLSYLVSYDDKISVNGKEIVNKPIRTQIYVFNKPAGYVTTNSDPQGRKTIFELIPSKFGKLISIGRLDINTEGLLLLTNNGELSRIMEMPATGLKRVYYARVVGEITDELKKKIENLRNGIDIEGVHYGKMLVFIENGSTSESKVGKTYNTLKIVIFEGKNNEIRRIMWHLGLRVVKLTRVQYGDFRLNGLPSGCIQESRIRVNLRDLEKQASINIKKYNAKKEQNSKTINKNEENGNKDNNKVDKKLKKNNDDKKNSFDSKTDNEDIDTIKTDKENKIVNKDKSEKENKK